MIPEGVAGVGAEATEIDEVARAEADAEKNVESLRTGPKRMRTEVSVQEAERRRKLLKRWRDVLLINRATPEIGR